MEKDRKFLRFFDMEDYGSKVPKSDQENTKPIPPLQKEYQENSELIDLISPENFSIGNRPFLEIINSRVSRRKYTQEPITLEELSYLLWCTQGVKKKFKYGVMRTVPSAGARSPFESYLIINRVEGLKPGLYRYISFEHKLLFVKPIEDAENKIGKLAYNQMFVGKGAVIFCWVAVPYRTEWRYTILAQKFIAIDIGLVCENLYLACESVNLGTVAIGYYEQNKLDKILELDGKDEFVILIAPIGRIPKRKTEESH